VPTCPRHEHRLADNGPRPASVALAIRVGGVLRLRFVVHDAAPVVVGREPTEPGAVRLAPWLAEDARMMVSRSHLIVSLGAAGLEVRDTSTNGTVVRRHTALDGSTEDIQLSRGDSYVIGDRDVVQLYDGVELARATRWRSGGAGEPRSVMAEAPTMAIRLPGG
jgi:predicted component of type VI protein secretion system